MKTKSYTIHTKSGVKLQIDETPEQTGVVIKIIGPTQFITLDSQEWQELCGMKYDLECHEANLPGQAPKLSDIKLELPTDQLKQEMEKS
jgi:hypothetical protein